MAYVCTPIDLLDFPIMTYTMDGTFEALDNGSAIKSACVAPEHNHRFIVRRRHGASEHLDARKQTFTRFVRQFHRHGRRQ
jgi:hypothetical protein